MAKRTVSEVELKAICLTALSAAKLNVADISLVVAGEAGAQCNWELRALSPEPDFETAEMAPRVITEVQAAFDIGGAKTLRVSAFG